MAHYNALFEPDKEQGGFVVTFPDFEWGITQGDTEEEAAVMAADALAMVIGDYIEKGMPLPSPRSYRGKKYRAVQLPALITAKAELYRAFTTSGIRKADLARRWHHRGSRAGFAVPLETEGNRHPLVYFAAVPAL